LSCAQLTVQQNYPLNDQGTGLARTSHSSFQPLGTNVGAISTPQQNSESALASMGQPGHIQDNSAAGQSQSMQQQDPNFRCGSQEEEHNTDTDTNAEVSKP
jgi:hypothetical protein